MSDYKRLSYIYSSEDTARKAAGIFTKAFRKFPKRINWTKVSFKMGQILEKYVDADIFIYISAEPTYTYYDTCIDGASTVPSLFELDKDIEIDVGISEDLFYNRIPVNDDYIKHFESMFILTFIHELTHTTQFDDEVKMELRGSKREQYLSSPFELDAYSAECAYDMTKNGGKRTTTEAYLRYNSVRDRNVFRKFRDMTLEKYTYLKNHK